MTLAILYGATLASFLVIDVIGLKLILKPLFDKHVADLMRETFFLGIAGLFYCVYVAGILYFVSLPALETTSPVLNAIRDGAILGLIAYGTYEATNMATLRGWSWEMVVVDVLWGAFLTASAAAIGVLAVASRGAA